MAFVVDASVALRWYLIDEATAYSAAALDLLGGEPAYAPALWPAEFANVILKLRRQKRLKPAVADAIIEAVQLLPIVIDAEPAPVGVHYGLARQFNLTPYDSAYLELAMRRKLQLATIDGGLRAAAKKAGVLLAFAFPT